MRSVLSQPDFRILFAGVVTSMVGESTLLLVLAIWVKDLTNSSSLAGMTIFAIVMPALAAPLLGWMVDRFRRRSFLIAANLATAAALSPLLLVHDSRGVPVIFSVAVLYGVSMLVVNAALNGLITQLIPPAQLAEANGALQTVRQGLRLVGPICGAALFTLFKGATVVVSTDIVCLVLAAAAIAKLHYREIAPRRSEIHWLTEVGAGMRHLIQQPALRRATTGWALAVAVAGFTESLIFTYVDQGLHQKPAFVSVFVCIQGIGGLIGGLFAARTVKRTGEIGATAAGVMIFAFGFGFMVYPALELAVLSAVLIGAGIPVAVVGFTTLLQRSTPAPLLGRASAASDAMVSTPQALSIAAGAALVSFVDYRLLFGVMAAVMVGAAAYLWAGRALSAPTPPPPALPAQAEA
jgi:MFS family permease